MHTRFRQVDERYAVRGGYLVRTVVAADGRSYAHRCSAESFRTVAYAVGEAATDGGGVTMESLAASENVPFTQANVALEFLKERGVAVTRLRRTYPASDFAFEDAMVEFHALREQDWVG